MRYGEGVSIASQRRWVRYVDLWSSKLDRKYTPSQVYVRKLQFWGMKIEVEGADKIEVGIAGFVDAPVQGAKQVDKIHVFTDDEVRSTPEETDGRERLKGIK
jgi:hypothetical protein